MQLMDELRLQAELRGAAFCKVVSLNGLDPHSTRGYRCGIVMGWELKNAYDFAEGEMKADRAADAIESWLRAQHFDALSQSERSMAQNALFDAETRSTTLPHKTLAVRAGLGWIGRNNLLVTEKHGCRLTLSTVLTDAPLPVEDVPQMPNRCGNCTVCVRACPVGALSVEKWTPNTERDDMVNVDACRLCLKCMQVCPKNNMKKR